MNDSGQRQRLAAILAADAAGYSRLMETDERATVVALDAARAVFRAGIESNGGRVIDMAGDSVLAIFETAAGAVVAALAIQGSLAASGREVPEARRMRFRVGVHLGDVIEKAEGSVYGDGVNIAARLQALAAPGGIVVSEAVRGAVKNRVQATFAELGAQAMKNIADPVRLFAVVSPELDTALAGTVPAKVRRGPPRAVWYGLAGIVAIVVAGLGVLALRTPQAPATPAVAASPSAVQPQLGRPSVAVLPFDNLSGDPGQAYFADGITEDLITDLSKVGGLTVIARNSSFQYKGRARDVREIGRALGARYVLEGSVRRIGDTVRINAQLIDAETGAHTWADRYDGEFGNIFALQDAIARNVAKALSVDLTRDDSARVAKRGTGNAQAYDMLLKGWGHYLRQTPEEFWLAIEDFKQASALDPDYGRAWAALAAIHWEIYTRYWGPSLGLSRHTQYEAEQYLARAMRDPTPLAHQVASAMLLHAQQHEQALGEAQKAIASDPNDGDGYVALASALSLSGRPAEALEAVEKAMRLNPHFPSSYAYQRGLALFGLKRLPEAAASLERALELNHDDYWSQRLLLSIYGLQGRAADAVRLTQDVRDRDRRGRVASHDPLTIRAITYWFPFARLEDAQRFAAGLGKAGIPE